MAPLNLDRVTRDPANFTTAASTGRRSSPTVEYWTATVNLTLTIGKARPRRSAINLIGNDTLPDGHHRELESHTSWLSWYKRDDQYSRESLRRHREAERLVPTRGYIDFSPIHPGGDQRRPRDMFITAGITEGDVYNFSDVTVSGDTVLPGRRNQNIVGSIPGNTFSRARWKWSRTPSPARLANIGYAFAPGSGAGPTIDRDKRTVAIDFRCSPPA